MSRSLKRLTGWMLAITLALNLSLVSSQHEHGPGHAGHTGAAHASNAHDHSHGDRRCADAADDGIAGNPQAECDGGHCAACLFLSQFHATPSRAASHTARVITGPVAQNTPVRHVSQRIGAYLSRAPPALAACSG